MAVVNQSYSPVSEAAYNSTSLPQTDGSSVIQLLSTTGSIDATAVAATNLYTVPTGKVAKVAYALILCTDADTVSAVATVGIGIAAGEDDIISATALTGVDTTDDFIILRPEVDAVLGSAADIIKIGIDTGATAVSQTISVALYGTLS